MALEQRPYTRTAESVGIDEGLRAHMLKVYNYMTTALLLTGLVAFFFGKASIITNDFGQIVGLTGIGQALFGSPLQWIVMLAPLGLIFYLGFKINTMSLSTAQTTFWIFSTLMGLSLASIFIVYTGASITRVFFIAAGMFAGTSLYGYTTKKDLTGMGSFLFMGLIGILIASVVNIFLASSAMQFAISVIGVLVFAGLTAYDTQSIKNEYRESDDGETQAKKSIHGALRLYLDFINLFIMLLSLFGNRD